MVGIVAAVGVALVVVVVVAEVVFVVLTVFVSHRTYQGNSTRNYNILYPRISSFQECFDRSELKLMPHIVGWQA